MLKKYRAFLGAAILPVLFAPMTVFAQGIDFKQDSTVVAKVAARNDSVKSGPFLIAENNILDSLKLKNYEKISGSVLKDVGVWGLGVSVEGYDALPSNLWKNSDVQNLSVILPKLNDTQQYSPFQILVRRILFSSGSFPEATDNLSNERFKAISKLGPLKANDIFNNYPNLTSNPDMVLLAANNWFYAGKNSDACSAISSTNMKITDKSLLKARASCYALSGEGPAAQLALDTALQGVTPSESDVWLSSAIAYAGAMKGSQKPSYPSNLSFRADSGMAFALSKKIGLTPDYSKISSYPNNALDAIFAYSAKNSSGRRLVTEEIIKRGVLDFSEYKNMNSDVLSSRKVSLKDGSISVEGENFANELRAASNIQEFTAISKRFSRFYDKIDNVTDKDSLVFAKAALLSGNPKAARKFLQKSKSSDKSLSLALAVLEGDASSKPISARLNGNSDNSAAIYDAIVASAFSLDDLPAKLLLSSSSKDSLMKDNVLYLMEAAANRGAMAETGLLASLVVQGDGLKDNSPYTILRIENAMKKAGLEDDAKDLAVFSILANNMSFSKLGAKETAIINKPSAIKPAIKPNATIKHSPKPEANAPKKPVMNKPLVKPHEKPIAEKPNKPMAKPEPVIEHKEEVPKLPHISSTTTKPAVKPAAKPITKPKPVVKATTAKPAAKPATVVKKPVAAAKPGQKVKVIEKSGDANKLPSWR